MECKWWHWSDHLHTHLHYSGPGSSSDCLIRCRVSYKIDIQNCTSTPLGSAITGGLVAGLSVCYIMLPFVLGSAHVIFTTFADPLHLILHRRCVKLVWHYINDFIVYGPPTLPEHHWSVCQLVRSWSCLLQSPKLLAPPHAWQSWVLKLIPMLPSHISLKTNWSSSGLFALMQVLLTKEVESSESCMEDQLGRSFLDHMINLLCRTDNEYSPTLPSLHMAQQNFRSDLCWWLIFCSWWNRISSNCGTWYFQTLQEPGTVVFIGMPHVSMQLCCHLGQTTSQSH